MRRHLALGLLGCALALSFVLSADSLAGEGDTKKAKAKPAEAKPAEAARAKDHLPFQKTYGAALLEARIRNLPIFVSRHKDF